MKITKKVFNDLAIFMIGFGLVIGLIFPVFVYLIGIPLEYINTVFIIACIVAGILVGLVNIVLARVIVGNRLKLLSDRMKYVNENLHKAEEMDTSECLERCMIPVDSEDVIGESSESFNNLVKSFLNTLESEFSIRNFTEIFTNELDLEKLSDKALTHLIRYTDAVAGSVMIDRGGVVEVSSSYLIKNPHELNNSEIVRKCFTTNQRIHIELNDTVMVDTGLVDFHPKSILLEPISYKNEVLGVVLLASSREFLHKVIEDLNLYMHGLSLGMHNAIIHDKLEQLAILDPLTKIYNRRYGMEHFRDDFSYSLRNNNPLGVMMLDIDHFKNVNDTYGHIVGDQVLIAIARIIKSNIRKGDLLLRYGGEEFMAVLPGASLEGVKSIAEKIRRYVEEHTVKYDKQEIKVTISIGGTSCPEFECDGYENMVERADKNLYESKDTGRNKSTIR